MQHFQVGKELVLYIVNNMANRAKIEKKIRRLLFKHEPKLLLFHIKVPYNV